MACRVPLERVLELCNPIKTPPWPFAEALSPADVLQALTRNDLSAIPVPHEAPLCAHARRIAYFVRHGWADALDIDVGVPGAYEPSWPLDDGNHRLYAAVIRRDHAILVDACGSDELIAELLGADPSRPIPLQVHQQHGGHIMETKEGNTLLDVEFYINAAQQHGEDSEPDHEVGDLQEFLRKAWALLTPDQKLQFARDESVHDTLDATLVEYEEALDELPAPDVIRVWLEEPTEVGSELAFADAQPIAIPILEDGDVRAFNIERAGEVVAQMQWGHESINPCIVFSAPGYLTLLELDDVRATYSEAVRSDDDL